MNIILKDKITDNVDTDTYEKVMTNCIQKLKDHGSKRTQTATSVKKLREVIEEMARFMSGLSRDNRFKSRNQLCIGYSITQPLLSTHFENSGIKIHHNVVHDLINQFCIRDHSYCNNDERAQIYTKTTTDWDNDFKYLIQHHDDFNNHDSNHWKLQYLQQNPQFKLVINQTIGHQNITINNLSFNITDNPETDDLAIIGRLSPKCIQSAIQQTRTLISRAQKLLTPIVREAKIIRLQKNLAWLHNCAYNDGLYLDIYKLSPCGRQYGLGTTIQNINREIRRRLLKHNIAYDQRGSHLNIIINKALAKGLETTTLQQYLGMTELQLQTLVKESKMHRKSLKLTILSMINGYKGDKIWRHQFLQKLFLEITTIQKSLNYTSKDLFEAERIITTQKINQLGINNILSLEFDGFTANQTIQTKSDKLWKAKRL